MYLAKYKKKGLLGK